MACNCSWSSKVRNISYVSVVKEMVYLIDIYDKANQATISDKELKILIDLLAEE